MTKYPHWRARVHSHVKKASSKFFGTQTLIKVLRQLKYWEMKIGNVRANTSFVNTMPYGLDECKLLEEVYNTKFSGIDISVYKTYAKYKGRVKYPELIEAIPCEAKVLDLGCGSGVVLHDLIVHKNASVTGLELRTDIVHYARDTLGLDVYQSDLNNFFDERLQWAAKQNWDIVTCLGGALANLSYPVKILQIFRKSTIYVHVLNIGYWFYRARLLFGRFPFSPTTNVDPKGLELFTDISTFKFYSTLKDFEEIMKQHGFKAERISFTGVNFFGMDLFIHTTLFKLTHSGDFQESSLASSLEEAQISAPDFQGRNAW